jgi:RecA/RadA recombinase
MTSTLIERLLKSNDKSKTAQVLSNSDFFNLRDTITTELPILNLAFSAKIDGGFSTGLTILAGESKSFKTMLSLYCLKAYLDEYKDAVCLFYDSEFGTPPAYLKAMGIDTDRIIHIPIEHVEHLKFDMVKRLAEIKKGDKVFIFVDSLGNLASKKEVEDADKENSVVDMSRAKAIRSFFRITTPHFAMKDIPCFIINHVYETQEKYSKVVIPGGTAVTYAANQIFVIKKTQVRDEKTNEIISEIFKINVFKSRFINERSVLPFTVNRKGGIQKYSGMFDLLIEAGLIQQFPSGWYKPVDPVTGEVPEKKVRSVEIPKDTIKALINSKPFADYCEARYALGSGENLLADFEQADLDDIIVETDSSSTELNMDD